MSELIVTGTSKVEFGRMSDASQQKFDAALKQFESEQIEWTIKKKRKRTSMSQRGYYFAAIVTAFRQGAQEEWGEYLSKQTAHENLKKECNFKEFVTEAGEIVKVVLSTENLNTLEREEYHTKCRNLIFNYFGIVCEMPGEQSEMFNQ